MSTALHLTIVNFTKDAYIIVEGKQNADHFFILRTGKVRISKEVEVVQEEGGNHPNGELACIQKSLFLYRQAI